MIESVYIYIYVDILVIGYTDHHALIASFNLFMTISKR